MGAARRGEHDGGPGFPGDITAGELRRCRAVAQRGSPVLLR